MAAAKKSGATPAAAAPAAAPVTPPEATEETGKKKRPDLNEREYVILLQGKRPVRGFCTDKKAVVTALESLSSKEREMAFVYRRVDVEVAAKVSIKWPEAE